MEAREKILEAEVAQTRDTVVDLETGVEGHKATLVEKDDYIAQLEEKHARVTSNSLRLEGQLQSCQVW